MTDFKKLRSMAHDAHLLAYSPYSKAKVGCSLVTETGTYFSGANIENGSYGATVCAERVAIFKAISEGSKQIKRIYVYTKDGWPPCGMCLQVISEFSDENLEIIIGNQSGEEKTFHLKDLLPLAFRFNPES